MPEHETPTSFLARLTREGERRRYPSGTPMKVQALIRKELELIAELRYEHYFLTIHDIVDFARRQGILCQGRGGSAANSAVCYCLGITEVNPANVELLFERFISKDRDEPPPTSMWISSTNGVKRLFSTFTSATAVSGPPWPPP